MARLLEVRWTHLFGVLIAGATVTKLVTILITDSFTGLWGGMKSDGLGVRFADTIQTTKFPVARAGAKHAAGQGKSHHRTPA